MKFLMIETGSELEMGIPPNVSALVSVLISEKIDVKVFSTNLYVSGGKTGDQVRVETLQVPPTSSDYLSSFKKDMKNVFEDLLTFVKEYKPDVVGISITEPMFIFGMELLNYIRDYVNFIIVGGAFPTLSPENVIIEKSVDAICIGEGEVPLIKLCNSITEGEIDYDINNLWFNVDGEVVSFSSKYESSRDAIGGGTILEQVFYPATREEIVKIANGKTVKGKLDIVSFEFTEVNKQRWLLFLKNHWTE